MDEKDKSEIIFDPTTKLKDEILENDRKYLINSRVIPFNGAFEPGYIHIKKEKDCEFWDKVAEELKPAIKRALEETFEPTKCNERNMILQNRLEDYPMLKEQKCECHTCIYAPNKECGWYAACNNCINGSNYWRKSDE